MRLSHSALRTYATLYILTAHYTGKVYQHKILQDLGLVEDTQAERQRVYMVYKRCLNRLENDFYVKVVELESPRGKHIEIEDYGIFNKNMLITFFKLYGDFFRKNFKEIVYCGNRI